VRWRCLICAKWAVLEAPRLWASGNEDSGNLGSLGGTKFDQHLEAGRIVFFGMFGALGSGRC
jgi:hypothetical protein